MKHKFSTLFNFVSKHYKFLFVIIGVISTFLFTFVYPLLLQWVSLPVWFLVLLLFLPFLIATAIAGFGNDNFAIANRDIKEYYLIPKFQHKKIDFMIEVEGSSMYPKYNSGDVVACTIINESSFIQWNKVHVVATKEQGIIIKRIKKASTPASFCMISDNAHYDPFDVPESEITGIALVVGVIRLE